MQSNDKAESQERGQKHKTRFGELINLQALSKEELKEHQEKMQIIRNRNLRLKQEEEERNAKTNSVLSLVNIPDGGAIFA